MKCPKCSYVSFEYLSDCRKCGKDLDQFKTELGIDIVQPVNLGIVDFLDGGGMEADSAFEEIADAAVATGVAEPEEGSLPSADDLVAEEAVAAPEEIVPEEIAVEEEPGISLDLGDETEKSAEPVSEEAVENAVVEVDDGGIDFDLDLDQDLEEETTGAETPKEDVASGSAAPVGSIDFNIDLDEPDTAAADDASSEDGGLSIGDDLDDLSLGVELGDTGENLADEVGNKEDPGLELDDLDLDLDDDDDEIQLG